VQITVVVPMANTLPEAAEHVGVIAVPPLSLTAGSGKVTVAPPGTIRRRRRSITCQRRCQWPSCRAASSVFTELTAASDKIIGKTLMAKGLSG
jgi:hypothetical protein